MAALAVVQIIFLGLGAAVGMTIRQLPDFAFRSATDYADQMDVIHALYDPLFGTAGVGALERLGVFIVFRSPWFSAALVVLVISIVVCTIDAVWLGTAGGTEGVQATGLPALSDLYAEFVDNGGQIWLCGACTKPQGITQEHVAKGATIVGAAKVVEEVVGGAKTIAFA